MSSSFDDLKKVHQEIAEKAQKEKMEQEKFRIEKEKLWYEQGKQRAAEEEKQKRTEAERKRIESEKKAEEIISQLEEKVREAAKLGSTLVIISKDSKKAYDSIPSKIANKEYSGFVMMMLEGLHEHNRIVFTKLCENGLSPFIEWKFSYSTPLAANFSGYGYRNDDRYHAVSQDKSFDEIYIAIELDDKKRAERIAIWKEREGNWLKEEEEKRKRKEEEQRQKEEIKRRKEQGVCTRCGRSFSFFNQIDTYNSVPECERPIHSKCKNKPFQ